MHVETLCALSCGRAPAYFVGPPPAADLSGLTQDSYTRTPTLSPPRAQGRTIRVNEAQPMGERGGGGGGGGYGRGGGRGGGGYGGGGYGELQHPSFVLPAAGL